MRRNRRLVIVLHRDPLLREQLRIASKRGLECEYVPSWELLTHAIRTAPASAVVVVDPYHGARRQNEIAGELRALLRQYPSLTVVAALPIVPGCLEHARSLGELGVAEIICLGEEETALGIEYRLAEARGRPLYALVERSLSPNTSGPARSILTEAVAVVIEGGQGADLARALHITPRTLQRWCRRAKLPAPRRLLAWIRVLLAAELLDDPGRTVSDVALSCGYAADTSLRHALHSLVGLGPGVLRSQGAFSTVAAAFVDALVEARAEYARYRRNPPTVRRSL